MSEFLNALEKNMHEVMQTTPAPKAFDLMQKYYDMLIEWNKRMNLTRILSPEDAASKHFLDSLLPYKFGLLKDGDSLIDIGTGAGFPGMVLKIINPTLKLTLLDSQKKKTEFLSCLADELGIECSIVHSRIEDFGRGESREVFDVVTSRALAAVNVLAELALSLAKVEGRALCYKGPTASDELSEAKNALNILGASAKIFDCSLSWGDRTIVELKKNKQTPPKYPRKAGTPSKQPLI